MQTNQTTRDPAEVTRTEILRHAHDLFAHYGFDKTNIGDSAKCCGMSPGNLYRYFRNKQAIGLAAVQQYFDAAETAMDAAMQQPGGMAEERIKRFVNTGVQHIVDELNRNPRIVELAEFLCQDEEGLEILGRHIVWRRAQLTREIARGVTQGELAPCDAEQTAITLQNGLKTFWMPMTLATWRDPATIMPELADLLDLIFRGLRV